MISIATPAISSAEPREIERHYRQQQAHSRSLFRTLPGTHFSPKPNSLLIGQSVEYIDASVNGQNTSSFGERTKFDESLDLSGFTLSPSFTLAGKYFGVGLSGSFGKRSSKYRNDKLDYTEQSRMDIHGGGAHIIWNPIFKSQVAKLSFTLGAKKLKIRHLAQSNTQTKSIEPFDWEQIDYQVFQGYLGAHLKLQITKQLFIIPWINHSYTDGNSPTHAADKSIYNQRFSGDQEVYLNPGSTLSYGFDIGVVLNGVQLNVGNLVGFALANEDVNSARIKDRSINVNISAEFH